ncbi:hypothetical protein [Bifidobacterium callitrichos]|uniref:Uncharacterized protein n=1 Tax=Bifidobacterium callitrichos DSM 23973 TaxID=1437609 RepID=A0A087ACS8_9BIFI|nr:hypothetical protein [Bifidobacterium callitrichos]KFI56578.1 hypothetical protein BCAL_0173 [Bifidobacterium callitrichos DSM 23973]
MSDNEHDEEYDRFVFHPGDLKRVTDPQQLASIYEKTGVHPYAEEKQDWISHEAKQRFRAGLLFSTNDLADEYDRLKAQGKL